MKKFQIQSTFGKVMCTSMVLLFFFWLTG